MRDKGDTQWWASRATQVLAAAAMAGIAGAAVVLERRRSRRGRRSQHPGQYASRHLSEHPRHAPPAAAPATTAGSGDPAATQSKSRVRPPGAPEQDDPPAPMSPARFTAVHFGLLALLVAVSGGGLAWRGIHRYPPEVKFHVHGGDPERGRRAMLRHGCGGCHAIPGVSGAAGRVGPSLDGFAERTYVAGQLPNTPEHLIAWLLDPPRYAPGTAMPKLPVTESEARDMAAYLYAD